MLLICFVFDWVDLDNIVGKGENAGYQHFLLFPQCLQKASTSGVFKQGIVWSRIEWESSCLLASAYNQ